MKCTCARRSRRRSFATAAVAIPATIIATRRLRRYAMTWGATPEEIAMALPGDDLVKEADRTSTRSVSIDAPPEQVWPWLLQLGHQRGGFYSYDFLENLVGLGIHSAEQIEDRWQDLQVGDRINLAEGMGLDVTILDPARALVLQGGELPEEMPTPDFDFTWAFILNPAPDGSTRLVVRERYAFDSVLVSPVITAAMWISALMTSKMLRGIKERAERR